MSTYWKPAPFHPDHEGHTREFFYVQNKRRGEVERFSEDGPSYATASGQRSGAMTTWEAAKAWVEKRVPRVVE